MQLKIKPHNVNDTEIAEVVAEETIINSTEEGLDLLGNLYYQGYDRVIVHEKNITPDFFDLRSGIAGEILQKFSTYRVRLAIVGDFSKYTSNSLKEFIFESNRNRHINFVRSSEEAIRIFTTK